MAVPTDRDIVDARPARVPPAARAAAYAVPLCVLPSALWRIGHAVRATVAPGRCDTGSLGEAAYLVGLSVVSVGAAFLTVGLVRPWGERFPGWLPVVGDRPVPARAATVAALTGATIVGLLTVYAFTKEALGIAVEPRTPPGCHPPGLGVAVLYLPLPAWSPLLFVVAVHYKRRRGVHLFDHPHEAGQA